MSNPVTLLPASGEHDPAPPGTADLQRRRLLRMLAAAVSGWALVYGAVRAFWASNGRPELPPTGDDLLSFSDWGIVVLSALAALTAVPLGSQRVRHALGRRAVSRPARTPLAGLLVPAIGLTTGVLLLVAAAPFVLDLVALVFPSIGIPTSPVAFGTRFTVVAGAGILLALTVLAARDIRRACQACGRGLTDGGSAVARPAPKMGPVPAPGWARVAAYVAVVGLVARELAQLVIGFGPADSSGGQGAGAWVAFVIAATLAGTLLPLAMVHRWGQRWPRWVPWLSERRVPRWLPLGPAFGVSAALLIYFGVSSIQLMFGSSEFDTRAEQSTGFLGFAIGAYLVWGAGLGIAALSYFFRTRPRCRRCEH